jgi:hypothetical protein
MLIFLLCCYVNITPFDAVAVKTALVNEGPISIAIDAAHKSLVFYDHGLYVEPECKNGVNDLDHAVLLVGFGTIFDQPYWLIKNRYLKKLVIKSFLSF